MSDGEPRDILDGDAEKVMQQLEDALEKIDKLEGLPERVEKLKKEIEQVSSLEEESLDYRIARVEQKIDNLINNENILGRLKEVEDTAEKALKVAQQIWRDTRHIIPHN